METEILILGAGISGLTAAAELSQMGYQVTILEKQPHAGGHIAHWNCIFPTMDSGSYLIDELLKKIKNKVTIITNAQVQQIDQLKKKFHILYNNNKEIKSNVLLVATGYDLFNAVKKEEYGYSIYDNVITSADFEKMLQQNKSIIAPNGIIPKRIGFVHCVGSRDEKVKREYCSSVCCMTAVKQAIQVKERLPESEVFSFYMDLRMHGRHYEKLYREAQEKWGINYIRGRLSEASETIEGRIYLKLEDTLAGRPLKMTVDLLVLMVGMELSWNSRDMAKMMHLNLGHDRFILPLEEQSDFNKTTIPGLFVTGTCTGPKTVKDSIADARSAALKVIRYLHKTSKPELV